MSLVQDLKWQDNLFNDDEEEHSDIDDVGNDDGQVPDIVVAGDIFLGLCFLF